MNGRSEGAPAGGFTSVDTSDPHVTAAAEFAAAERAKVSRRSVRVVGLVRAEQQVVSGRNYRLCLDVEEDSAPDRVQAVVYRDLAGHLTLTAWEPGGCG